MLPGNAGLDLVVRRTYNSKIHPDYEDTHNYFQLRTWVSMGWSLHFGRVVQSQSFTPGAPTIQMSDGSRHALYNALDPGNPHGSWVTSELWRYRRAFGTDPARLKLPNGLTYEFGHLGIPGGPEGAVLYVTEIRDPFNNRLTFEYFQSWEGPTDGVKRIVQHLGNGQQREVTFAVTPLAGGYALASMTYAGRTWTYTHTAGPAPYDSLILLTGTSAPVAGTTWSFAYRDVEPGPELLSVTGPYGGQLTYTYARVDRPVGDTLVKMRSVITRHTSGSGIPPGQWTFNYTSGANQNTTVITTPCGRETYTYLGVGTLGPPAGGQYAGWQVGALTRSTTESLDGDVLEARTFLWQPSATVSDDSMEPFEELYWGFPDVVRALPLTTIVDRGGQQWQTLSTYAATNYNDYFQPSVVETWDVTAHGVRRVVNRRFWDGAAASLYMPRRVDREDVFVGTEWRAVESGFEAATGFRTQTIQRRQVEGSHADDLTTSFTASPQGNVASVTDAMGKTTSFTYSWGVPSQVQTPLLTTTRVIFDDGTVTSETVGGALTTSYTYDALRRPTEMQGPGGTTPTVITYAPTYTQTTRGTSYVRSYPDAFGRAVRSEDPDALKRRVAFDACGRVTFESAAYTTGAGTRGVATGYDALGRVRSTSTIDDSGTATSTTTIGYDGIDVTVTDALNRATTYDYYSDSGPGGAHLVGLTDAAGHTTAYTYDIAGALTSTDGPVAGVRTWTYDGFGRPTSETHPEAGTTTLVPNAVGNVTSLTNAAGQTLTFSYDDNHRLTGRDGLGTASDVTITYDPLGRVQTENVAGDVLTEYTYDPQGRPASRKDTTGGLVRTSTYGYDTLDRLTTLTYPSLNVAGYQYTASGRLSTVSYQGQTFASGFDHDDSGRLTRYMTGPVTHELTYDSRDRTTSIDASSTLAGTALQLDYTYNAVSLVTALSDHRPLHNQTFGYDALNRLTSAEGPYGTAGATATHSWTYDAAGNRTVESRSGGSLTYTYDSGTRRLTSVGGLQAATFAYDAAGRTTSATTSPGGTTTYAYSLTGLLSTIATPTVTAGQVYDASEWRVRKDVTIGSDTTRTFSLRSLGGQMLSEFQQLCTGCPIRWIRDVVYAGGRPLGASTANLALPVVEFAETTSSVNEGVLSGKALVAVRITTADGLVLPQPVTVEWAVPGLGTATPGVDYVTGVGSVTFPAGSESGSDQLVEIPLHNDLLDEAVETFEVHLTGVEAQRAQLGGWVTHTVSIVDDDDSPTMSIAVDTDPVGEPAGSVSLTVSLSAESGQTVAAWVTAVSGSAKVGRDFVATQVIAAFAPGATTTTVTVPLIDDVYAEPSETFTVSLSGLSLAHPGVTTATVTIADNDGPWVDIDPAYPGDYFARAWTPGEDSYLQIYNPHDVAVTARVTYIRATGAGVRRAYALGARQRLGLHVPSDTFVADQGGQGSAVVQSLDVSRPLVAELSGYAGSGWQTGESTEGVSPAPTWTLAEGATGLSVGFQEWITVFNPSSEPVTANLVYYGAAGMVGAETVAIPSGPGLFTRHVNIHWSQIEHSTKVTAVGQDSGTAVPIVIERRMRWQGSLEGHSSTGQHTASGIWEFPEGGTGLFSTFLALFNPHATAATVRLYYRHENGTVSYQDVGVPAQSRITVGSPGFLPPGAYATEVYGLTHAVFAERVVYAGMNWTIGHASPGAMTGGTLWRFADGSSSWLFETYFILVNPADSPATVTLTYRNAAGGVIGTDSLVIPAYLRASVWANATVGGQDFTTEVSATQAIVAERVMYWPTGSSLLGGGGESLDTTAETSALAESPPLVEDSGGGVPAPYTLTEGVQGPTQQLTDTPEALVIGKPTPNATQKGSTEGGMQSQSSGLPWYGSHLAVGKKP